MVLYLSRQEHTGYSPLVTVTTMALVDIQTGGKKRKKKRSGGVIKDEERRIIVLSSSSKKNGHPISSKIELKRAKSTTDGSASRTTSSRTIFGHQNVDAIPADATDTIGASEGAAKGRARITHGAIDLNVLRAGRR